MLQHEFVAVFDPLEANQRRRRLLELLLKPVPTPMESRPDSANGGNLLPIGNTPPKRFRSSTKGRSSRRQKRTVQRGG